MLSGGWPFGKAFGNVTYLVVYKQDPPSRLPCKWTIKCSIKSHHQMAYHQVHLFKCYIKCTIVYNLNSTTKCTFKLFLHQFCTINGTINVHHQVHHSSPQSSLPSRLPSNAFALSNAPTMFTINCKLKFTTQYTINFCNYGVLHQAHRSSTTSSAYHENPLSSASSRQTIKFTIKSTIKPTVKSAIKYIHQMHNQSSPPLCP